MVDDKDKLSADEITAINKDIEDAKSKLLTNNDSLASKIREDIMRELELKRQIEDSSKKNKELEDKLKEQETKAAETLNALKIKVDELTSSKAVVTNGSPIKTPQDVGHPADKLDDNQVELIEQESARAFFGPTWDRHSE